MNSKVLVSGAILKIILLISSVVQLSLIVRHFSEVQLAVFFIFLGVIFYTCRKAFGPVTAFFAAWNAHDADAVADVVHRRVVTGFIADQQARIDLEVAVVREWHPECGHRFGSGLVHAGSPLFAVLWRTVWQNDDAKR